jgi:hypothetical protein
VVLGTPVGVCFRSNEPKLNPNSLADLGILRRQLTTGLRMVQLRERALAKALSPKTVRQIETAEAFLNNALRDLKSRKQFVQARAAAATKKVADARKPVTSKGKVAKKQPAKKAAAKKGGRRK